MSKFETAFKAAIAENERRILITTLLASPELTLGEIHKLSKGTLNRLFSEITIADLTGSVGGAVAPAPAAPQRGASKVRRGAPAGRGAVGGARRGAPQKAAAPAAPAAAPVAAAAEVAEAKGRAAKPVRGKAKTVNTRTAEGREAYDESLFQAVKEHGGPVGAGAIIARVGGSSLQARAGLARLIEAGKLTWSGKARGTKYSLA